VLNQNGKQLISQALAWAVSEAADPARAANDDFADRLPLDGTATGSTTHAGLEVGEPRPPRNDGSRSVWWTWTARASGMAVISTAGSGSDTVLGVWTGDELTGLNLLAENDDVDGLVTSEVTIPVTAGEKYQIAVYADNIYWPGTVELALDFEPFALPVTWDFQLIVYETTDAKLTFSDGSTHHVRGTMSTAERDEFIERTRIFVEDDLPLISSGSAVGMLEVTIADRPLTELERLWSGFTPMRVNVQPEINPDADAVLVLFEPRVTDVDTGAPFWIGAAAGLAYFTGTGQLYNEFVIDNVVYNNGMRNTNVLKHEYGHSLVFFHDAMGFAPKPAVDNHINDYGHCPTGEPYVWVDEFTSAYPHAVPNSIYDNWSGYHHDILSGTIALSSDPTTCLGIPPFAWALAETPSDVRTLKTAGEPVLVVE
jgi:hypothetical protein